MEWQDPENAPLEAVFIGVFKHYPYPVQAVWCGADGMFVAAKVQAGLYDGEFNDFYFENEQFNESDLVKWMPMPEV